METTEQRVQRVIVECLGVHAGEFAVDAALGSDLEADSLDLIEIEMACEEEFGIEGSDDLWKLTLKSTVADVISGVEGLLKLQ